MAKLLKSTLLRMAIECDESEDGLVLMAAMLRLTNELRDRVPHTVRSYGLSEAAAAEVLWSIGRLASKGNE